VYEVRLRRFVRASGFPVFEYGSPHFILTPLVIGTLRELPYVEQWRRALSEGWFHIRMEDQSLITFSEVANKPSHSFIHAPIDVPSFREYLASQGLEYTTKNIRANQDEYDLVMQTSDLRAHVTPIRFDYDPIAYRQGVHPIAHLHIGLDNDVRIAVSRCLSPESFLLFVMRQLYPQCWERLLSRRRDLGLDAVVRAPRAVLAEYWTEIDRIELHFA
jgi:Uncharacterized conserved protein (DUF2290)